MAIEREDSTSTQIYLAAALAHAGEVQQARAILHRLETTDNYVSPGELAVLYTALGERDRAFASLEKAFAARDLQLQYLGIDPGFDSLRGDRRFADLVVASACPTRTRRQTAGVETSERSAT